MAILALAEQFQTSAGIPILDVIIILATIVVVAWKFEGKRHEPSPLDWGNTVSDLWDLADEGSIRDYLVSWAKEKAATRQEESRDPRRAPARRFES
jgi:hypothetical protein